MDEEKRAMLACADDLACMAGSTGELACLAGWLEEQASKVELQINEEKTNYLVLRRDPLCIKPRHGPLQVRGNGYKQATEFKYLNSLFSDTGSGDMEISARLQTMV